MRRIWQVVRLSGLALAFGSMVLAAAVPAQAAGDDGLQQALATVDRLGHEAVGILRDAGLEPGARQAALAELVHRRFALERIGRLALGRYWRNADPAEQAAYAGLFERYVLATYARLVDFYTDQRLEVAAAMPVKGGVLVSSQLVGRRSAAIDWRLVEDGQDWVVVDVVVEGVSMLLTQRNEFASIIERNGGSIRPLLAHLEERVAMAGRPPG